MQLSERKQKILQFAVEEYIKACSPITSIGLKDISSLSCSAATLRSELNALEAMGFLRQLHTSGGRVPTAEGYRFYVQSLLGEFKATNSELEKVRVLIEKRTSSLSDLVSSIAKVVSEATNYPTVVMISGIENLVLQDFQIIPLLSQQVMILVGTNSGYLNFTLPISATKRECDDAARYLKKRFIGKSINELTSFFETDRMLEEITSFQTIVDALVSGLKRFNVHRMLNVEKAGAVKLLESGNAQNAKNIFSLLEDEDELIEVLDIESESQKIVVSVADNESDPSVIKVPIKVGEASLSIGVIGPQRMDYGGVSAALKLLIDELDHEKGGNTE